MNKKNFTMRNTWARVLTEQSALCDSSARVSHNFEEDFAHASVDLAFIFQTDRSQMTQHSSDLLHKWAVDAESGQQAHVPSLVAMCAYACEQMFDDTLATDLHLSVLFGAILGEGENVLPYHGNLHYKKVLLQLLCLIEAHNDIYAETPRVLSADEIAVLMIAACVHDVGHDGLGNTVEGVFTQGRLERQSYEIASPVLEMSGLNETHLFWLKTIILTTDVSPAGQMTNPAAQMKSAYRYHYKSPNVSTYDGLNLSPPLKVLEQDKRLAMMALLMHEADIATSAGVDYDVSKYETILYAREINKPSAHPHHLIEFLEKICQSEFLSDAAQSLYAANIARISALARADFKNGDLALNSSLGAQKSDSLDSPDCLGDTTETIDSH